MDDDGYDQFIRQEIGFVSSLVDICRRDELFAQCGNIQPGIYYSMRWSQMDEDERDLYKLLSKSSMKKRSYNELNFHHKLKELLSDNDNDNDDSKPIDIPLKRLNINNKLLVNLGLFEHYTTKFTSIGAKRIRRKKNHLKNINNNYDKNFDEEKDDVDTVHEIQEKDINQLLRIREDYTKSNGVTKKDNDGEIKYSTDETDISQLLLGLKEE